MVRKLVILLAAGLTVAVPTAAAEVEQVRIAGTVVRASAEAVSVENAVGDMTLTCRVPERLAERAAALEPGDRVRMTCVRARGRRAELLKLEPLAAKQERPEARVLKVRGSVKGRSARLVTVETEQGDVSCAVPEKLAEHVLELAVGDRVAVTCRESEGRLPELVAIVRGQSEKPAEREQTQARGPVVELGAAAIVVEDDSGHRVACRVPAEKSAKVAGLAVGDRVKLLCAGGVVTYLERLAVEETKIYGRIAELGRDSVTVAGDGRTLRCTAAAELLEKLRRFAVGDSVKMICRGSSLTYLEKA